MKYNLTKEQISIAIVEYILNNKIAPTVDTYDIKFIIEDIYQKDSLTGFYKPELKGAEISVYQ